ncbi:hypothetical protein C1I95_04225 [Micromonospora craterilacus]|uniref:Uncharacterized protein n=1 Tax=Micromonospora craterilacus TaxID=1655439 RepID=A0A2W2FDX0_9ACTN|nr:hypothetical protein [Micromonospora craterilacus]PZG22898.1 hypothetical protein C1I95_04225 [Micromonospora craterilacus]
MAVTIAALTMSAGCTTGVAPQPRDAYAEQTVSQEWALADGVVTDEEYQTAVDRFLACMVAEGYRTTQPVRSPIDGLTLLYDVEPAGDIEQFNEKQEACNLRELSRIEPGYVEAREQHMDERVRTATQECLQETQVPLTGEERTAADFAAAADGSVAKAMSCIVPSARKFYPDLPGRIVLRTPLQDASSATPDADGGGLSGTSR